MLAFALATFFAIALFGALSVIGLMFFGYHERIIAVLENGLQGDEAPTVTPLSSYRHRAVKPRQMVRQYQPQQPVPMRVAA